jgi:hypothetical protein
MDRILRQLSASPSRDSLPPTRAARSARSRGVFFAGRGELGLGFGRGIASVLCIAVAALCLFAIAPRMIEAHVVVGNPALELVAKTAQFPAALAARGSEQVHSKPRS